MPTALLVAALAAAGLRAEAATPQSSSTTKTDHVQAPSPASSYHAVATFQEIMDAEFDVASDHLWKAVAVISNATGTHEHKPRTAAEWHELRQYAIVLAEAANLLLVPGRRVADQDKTIESHEPLDRTAIQRRLDANPAELAAFARTVQVVAMDMVRASDQRDVTKFSDLGGSLDEACEGCHRVFWYPDQPYPGSPAGVGAERQK